MISVMPARDVSAQLTLRGKIYIEVKRKAEKPNYEKIDDSQSRFEGTVDEILARLKKLGYGQDVIFDEIAELKELHAKLNKRNFGQVMKGKLIDLGLSKAIENDTISYIYIEVAVTLLVGQNCC